MLDRIEKGFRSQERFISEISHELRTPIAVLLGQAQVLGRQAPAPEEYDEFVGSVEAEMLRVAEILNSFMLLARANAGFRASVSRVVSLNDAVMRAVQRCSILASHRELKLVPRLWEGEPEAQVRGDEELIASMLTNLLTNAVHHSPVGQTVTIDVEVRGREAVLTVGDCGPGMPADVLNRSVRRPAAPGASAPVPGWAPHRPQRRGVPRRLDQRLQPARRRCTVEVRLPLATGE